MAKTKKARVEAHTSPSKFGMGDYYGQGKRNPIGRVRTLNTGVNPISKSKMKEPPKKLA